MKINEDILFYLFLAFRMLFYGYFLMLILSESAQSMSQRNRKLLNWILSFFALCYLNFIVSEILASTRIHALNLWIIVIWTTLFSYLYVFINFIQFRSNPITGPFYRNVIMIGVFITISYFNTFFNYHSYRGNWHADLVSEACHGILSLLLPVFAFFSKSAKMTPLLGGVVLILGIVQFAYGISLSYGVDGYFTDDVEFLPVFLMNSGILVCAGMYYLLRNRIFKGHC